MTRGSRDTQPVDLEIILDEIVEHPFIVTKHTPLLLHCQKCGGQWESNYHRRVVEGKGCPYCSGQKVLIGFNDLASRYPALVEEYSLLNTRTAEEISFGSGQNVLWNCKKCGQIYPCIVYNRAHLGRGCPYCAGKTPILGVNDLATLRPYLVLEWSKENLSKPEDFTLFSNKKVKWSCQEGHTWTAAIATRALGRNCKKCSRKESKGEKEVSSHIKSMYAGEIIENDRKVLAGLELDIYLPELRIAVEYNGDYWHSDDFVSKRNTTAEKLHETKRSKCEENDVLLLFVWESDWKDKRHEIEKALNRVIEDSSDIDSILQIVSKG